MANFSRMTLARIGRLVNHDRSPEGSKPPVDIARLAEWSGVGRKAIYNWTLPEDDAQYRAMPPVVKRVFAMIAYFGLLGQLDDQRLKDIQALEAALEDDAQFARLARRVSLVLNAEPPKPVEPAPQEAA
jgi:hypothetical protein